MAMAFIATNMPTIIMVTITIAINMQAAINTIRMAQMIRFIMRAINTMKPIMRRTKLHRRISRVG